MTHEVDDYTKAMNEHNARWEPALAAIRIAKAMREIARLQPFLSPDNRLLVDATDMSLTAGILERTVHFTPLDDEQKGGIWENMVDMAVDYTVWPGRE